MFAIVPAEIIENVTDLLENETYPVTFTCKATGEPVPTISWYFNDDPINVSNTIDYNMSSTVNGTVVESLLTVFDTQSSDVGRYICRAENIFGSDQSSGVLTINGNRIR